MKLIYVCPAKVNMAKVWTRPRESGHMDCCSESDRKGCLILFFHVIDIEDMLLLSASAWFVP